MSAAEVDVRALLRELRGIEKRAEDFSAITPIAAEILIGYVNDEWDSAGRGRWPGLAPSTLARRRGGSAEILKDTGRAAASVHPRHGPLFAEASTDVSYMLFHASDLPRSRMPLRNPFDVLDLALPEIENLVREHLAGGR